MTGSHKVVYLILGFICLGLGLLGALLPVVPATPFLIAAAYFFSKHSQKFYLWLLKIPWVGTVIKDWERDRAVKARTKAFAIGMLTLSVSISYFMLIEYHAAWRIVLVIIAGTGAAVVLSLPTLRNGK